MTVRHPAADFATGIARRQLLQGCAGVVASSMLSAHAQSVQFADRPIKLVVPTAAGGGNDTTGRIYAEKASPLLKRQMVVENLAGANGQVGARAVRAAKPDGHTLLWSSSSFTVFAPIAEAWAFDPLREFRMVARVLGFELMLIVSPSLGVRTVKEFLTKLRSERLPWGNSGVTTTPNIAASVFNEMAGGKGVGVPYPGSAPSLNALLGGHIAFMFNSLENVKGQLDAGKVVALATLSKERAPGLENVPTMAEAGFPEIMSVASWEFWYGLQAPVGVPNELVMALNDSLYQVSEDPAMKDRFQKVGLRVLPRSTPQEADRIVRQEVDQYRPLIKKVIANAATTK